MGMGMVQWLRKYGRAWVHILLPVHISKLDVQVPRVRVLPSFLFSTQTRRRKCILHCISLTYVCDAI